MANKKITELTTASSLATTDLVPVVTDPGGSAATKKATMATVAARVLTAPVITGGATVSSGGIAVSGNSTVTGTANVTGLLTAGAGVAVTGTCTATTFSGSGASLTALPAANLTGTLPAISGANLTTLSATAISSGTLNSDRLPANIRTSNVDCEQVAFPSDGSGYCRIVGATGSPTLMSVGTNNPSWITTTAPGGSSTTRYIKIALGGTTFLIEARSEL